MPNILTPTWDTMNKVVNDAKERVLICSPYFTTSGIEYLADNFGPAKAFQFWTRITPQDWASGSINPECLITLIDILQDSGRWVEFKVFPRLHAKAYVADYHLALIGSSNLSDGGFGSSLELLVQFKGAEAKPVIKFIDTNISGQLITFPIDAFKGWVAENKPAIDKLQDESSLSESLKDVQKSLDNILGYGKRPSQKKFDDSERMAAYVAWLQKNKNLPGAKVLIERIKNIRGDNLTGHFRQSFYGALGFFINYPENIEVAARGLEKLKSDEIYIFAQDLLEKWIVYFDENATLNGDQFNYAVLRGILPPVVGGTVTGGGGGISTFKRMFPLVARYLLEKENG
jgi:hypothetical protein